MKPPPFDYVRAESLAEAAAILSSAPGEARILAGGQSLIAMLNMRLATPRILVDVSQIREAGRIVAREGHISIGCAVRQAELERWPALGRDLPLIAKAMPFIGHVQTRSKGTICGSIAHGDPSSELPLCMATLDGDVVVQSRRGRRKIRGREFFLGPLQTACKPNELISEILLPCAAAGEGYAFNEMAIRHGDFAIVAIAAVARRDRLIVGIGGAGDRPCVAEWPMAEDEEVMGRLDDLACSLACRDDLHASAAYRRHLIRALGARTIEEARACRS
jgi:2-furoyl-CoA dehydrogenase FAD binding subunit